MDRIREERGQTMAEYGVTLAVITVGIVTVVATLGGVFTAAIARAAELVF